jgi:hypothetical protein
MKTCFRILILLSMILGLCAVTPQPVTAHAKASRNPAMPSELQEAFLAASARPFSTQVGTYTTEYNGLNYRFTTAGLQAEGNGIQWSISLRGLGRGNDTQDVQPPDVVQTEERLEYRRGKLTEWYRDTALGVEQGFDINEPPQGNGKLMLHLNLSTELEGQLNEDERGISFPAADGLALRYDHLKAFDANGVELDAKMIYNPAQVIIHVDDRSATYPITVDPIIYLEQKVIALDGELGDNFGFSVTIDGGTALIGAPYDDIDTNADQGSAYIFIRNGTIWIQQAKLTASDGTAGDNFGWSVAVDGDTALVGVRNSDVSAIDQGAAYVFVRSGTTWIQQAKLFASDAVSADVFGWSVALSGDTALVGAQWANINGVHDQGAAYVFVRSGATWTLQQRLLAPDGAADDHFGVSVALDGDTALIGADYDDVETNTNAGSAYVFVRSGTTWAQQNQFTGDSADQYFGRSVAIDNDTAVVGLPGISQVNLYVRSGTTWGWGDGFACPFSWQCGGSVSISGDTPMFGYANYNNYVDILEKVETGWSWHHTGASDSTSFAGSSVAISGDTGVVGVPTATIGSSEQGAVYFYQPYHSEDLAVSVGSGTGIAFYPDDTVQISVSVLNYGRVTTGLVTLQVTLPADLIYVSYTSLFGTFTSSTGVWDVGSIPSGVKATLNIQATAKMITTSTKTETFSAITSYVDNNAADNSASLTLTLKKKEQSLNGGFNTYTGTSKIPTGWIKSSTFATTDGKDTTAANRKEGTASVKITNTTARTKTLYQSITISGSAGDPFIFSYYVKGSTLPSAGTCQAQVLFYNGTAAVGTKTLACGSTGTFSYRKKTLSFTAPSAYTKVIVKFTYSKANSTVWFDLASLLR